MNLEKISVIVPVYKVEEYLKRCLDSLCKQSMHEIEIILVDDASPDRCGQICEEYAMKDSRFKVIHHSQNRGLSSARNTGINNANCDYLMFVDSDDWVHEDYCKIPYEYAIRYQSDLVMFKFNNIDNNKDFSNKKTVAKKPKNLDLMVKGYKSQREAFELLQCNTIWNAAWNKLYHKRLFQDVSYPEGFFYEDLVTTYKLVLKASKIYYIDISLYNYCFRAGSITTLRTQKALLDWFEMHMQQYNVLLDWGGYSSEKLNLILQNIAMEYCIKKRRDFSDANYVFCANILRNCNEIPKTYTKRRKLLFILFKYCPDLFEMISILHKRKYC